MVIGISGKLGSGKDTVGLIIKYLIVEEQRKLNLRPSLGKFNPEYVYNTYEEVNFQIKKFADKLKSITCLLLGCTREQLEDREFKEKELGKEWVVYYNEENRLSTIPFIDKYGESFKRTLTPRLLLQLLGTECGRQIIHPNIWCNSLFSNYSKDLNWCITDVRFPNEAQAIKDRNGILIRCNRGDGNTGNHPSETALDNYNKWDYVLDNNGTIEELIENVKKILIERKIL